MPLLSMSNHNTGRVFTFFVPVLVMAISGCHQLPDHTDKCWRAPSSHNSSVHGSITTGFGVGSGRGMMGGFPMGGMTGAGGMPGPMPTGMGPGMEQSSPFTEEQTARNSLPKDCMPPDFPMRAQSSAHQTTTPPTQPAVQQVPDTVEVSGIRIGP
ncbi:hypothetical protein HNW77_00245 [Komagataeibacter sp. AV436]|uniref:Uncharacterized protein n=2 Tax=Komagataeibacter melomenusus TaxID=2766578 RepID=A0ABX2A8N9_9PROT|nr:hypothetical protein [Komagataeibacter melomenusus]NPC64856.1 hypothetical protein [Komagataeibacter melomenusus]